MPVYRYRVRDKFGKLITGTIGGDNRSAVATHFESMGYAPVSITEESAREYTSLLARFNKVREDDMNLFNRQLVTLIRAGLPLMAGLSAIEKQTKSSLLKEIVRMLIKDIEGGMSFSDALARHPHVFDEMYINAIRAGELGGVLDEILTRLAELGEHEN